ncbi:Imm7 family immunity protein [Deinococcus lacus]|uniref:Imm7 family immunity protein n=1 Tax=Deinococcus lacus TaxID=392561 RepID=A0ABW1YE70_9DEIO
MVNFHGWFCLSSTFVYPDNLKYTTDNLIQEKLDEQAWNEGSTNLFAHIKRMNGGTYLYIGGDRNHFGIKDEIFELLEFIREVDNGAYGILYVHDDESRISAIATGYGVYIMKRGKIHYAPDPWLSPLIPTVEDEMD